jgi:hypothetical protein
MTDGGGGPDLEAILQDSEDPWGDYVAATTPAEKRALCAGDDEMSFWIFANLVTYQYLADNPNDWVPVGDHMSEWHTQMHDSPLNLILAARKHTKTTWVLLEIAKRAQFTPNTEILYWANTRKQVRARMGDLDDLIEANPWLDNLHKDGTAHGGTESKTFDNGAKLHTTSVSGSIEGAHVDMSIGDDPLKETGGIPDEQIEEWYGQVVVPMLNEDGHHVIVGTRKRPNDLYELLRTKNQDQDWNLPSYNLMEYPAVLEPWLLEYERHYDLPDRDLYTAVEAPELADALDVPNDTLHVLWPDARGVSFLKRKLGAMGRNYFVRELCMVFEQVDDAIIDCAAIEECTVDNSPPTDTDAFSEVVVGIDPATTAGGDDSAFVTVGEDDAGVRHVLNVETYNGIDPGRFKQAIRRHDDVYDPDAIAVESNGMQQYIVEDAVELNPGLKGKLEGVHTSGRKHSWKNGVPKLASNIDEGKYRFYGADEGTQQLVNTMTTLRMDDRDRLVGHTPDSVMALYAGTKAFSAGVPVGEVSVGSGTTEDVDSEFAESEIGRALQDQLQSLR